MISLFLLDVSPPKVGNKGEGKRNYKKSYATTFLRFSKPNFIMKTMCETIEKMAF
jgi:hypothetical protein